MTSRARAIEVQFPYPQLRPREHEQTHSHTSRRPRRKRPSPAPQDERCRVLCAIVAEWRSKDGQPSPDSRFSITTTRLAVSRPRGRSSAVSQGRCRLYQPQIMAQQPSTSQDRARSTGATGSRALLLRALPPQRRHTQGQRAAAGHACHDRSALHNQRRQLQQHQTLGYTVESLELAGYCRARLRGGEDAGRSL